jgi:hypothetical protein
VGGGAIHCLQGARSSNNSPSAWTASSGLTAFSQGSAFLQAGGGLRGGAVTRQAMKGKGR